MTAKSTNKRRAKTPREGWSDPHDPNRKPPIDWSLMTKEEHLADIRRRMTVVEVTPEYLGRKLREFEERYGIDSADFYGRWSRGEFHDDEYWDWAVFCEWALRNAAQPVGS